MSDSGDHNDDDRDFDDHTDPDRDTTPGRGQGNGQWLEKRLAETLESWGYITKRREDIIALEADVTARRKEFCDRPDDFVVAECKDWHTNIIKERHIIRLCLLAFSARAMPVLCHTTQLTERAWKLAQAYDVRLLTLEDLEGDELPPLTWCRPPREATRHRQPKHPEEFRAVGPMPATFLRFGVEKLCEAPIYGGSHTSPCYVVDRTGHEDYESTNRYF